jgi:hypothetical protein
MRGTSTTEGTTAEAEKLVTAEIPGCQQHQEHRQQEGRHSTATVERLVEVHCKHKPSRF